MIALDGSKPKLQLGLVLDSTFVSKYGLEFVKWARAQDRLELSHVLVLPPQQVASPPESAHFRPLSMKSYSGSQIAKLLFRLVFGIEKLLLLKNRRHYNHLQTFDLSALLPKDIFRQVDERLIHQIEELHLDLLVALTAFPPDIDISRAARLGMITISHCNDHIRRGGASGFWEVYFRDDVTGFTIRHMAGAARRDEVLLRGNAVTQFYYLLNQASLFEKSSYYLAKVVERIATIGALPKPDLPLPFCYRPRGIPKVHETIFYLAGLIRLLSRKLLEKARGTDFRWNVAFTNEQWRNAEFWRARIIQNPNRHYLADPFLIARSGKNFCFVEDYDQMIKRAKIVVYELEKDHATYVGVALEENFHLSFPYLFEYGNELYMCPELNENRDIRIYKCLEFPLRWKLEKIIMHDISAVDTMLFEKQGKWWMLTNVDPAKWGDFSMELRIFSANSPLDEQWVSSSG